MKFKIQCRIINLGAMALLVASCPTPELAREYNLLTPEGEQMWGKHPPVKGSLRLQHRRISGEQLIKGKGRRHLPLY